MRASPRLGWLALALALGLTGRATAVEPELLQSYRLDVRNGLANNTVFSVLQDRAGFMWFGTFGGLSRYDGETFETYRPNPSGPTGLAGSVVFALLEDSSGRIWIGTDGGGLSRYEAATGGFTTWRARPGSADALPSDRIFALAEGEGGELWIGTGDGQVCGFDPARGSFRLLPGAAKAGGAAVRALAWDGGHRLWAATDGGGLLAWEGGGDGPLLFRHDKADPSSLASNRVRSILIDSKKRLWLGLGEGGIELFDGGRFRHALFPKGRRIEEAVRALGEDGGGSIWVGFADSGLGTLDPESLSMKYPEPGDQSMVRSIYRDRHGLLWVGYKEGGVRAFNLGSSRFTRYRSQADGRPLRFPHGMAEDGEGRLYLGTDGDGLLSFAPGAESPTAVPGLPAAEVTRKVYVVLVGRDGRLWYGSDGGGLIMKAAGEPARVYRHDPSDPASLSSDVVWALCEDPDGTLWVGTEGGGLDRLSPGRRGFVHFRPDLSDETTLRGSSVRAILRDRARRLWVGTWDGGISVMEAGEEHFSSLADRPDDPSSLADPSVNCIFEDSRGVIWVGTGASGIARLDPATRRWRHYGEAEGLASETVYGILEDGEGDLWVSTALGVTRMGESAASFVTYGSEDGLASEVLAQNSFFRDRRGRLWFGGGEGLTSFDPRSLPRSGAPPEVALTRIEEAGSHLKPRISPEGRVELAFGNPGLSFHISVFDYAAPRRNRYAMQLEGRQAGWTSLGYSNIGYISPLAPGSYVLRVKGANGNGVWNAEGAALSIVVRPPVWATWWFRLLVAGSLAAAMGGAVLARLNGLRRRNALLVNFSRHVQAAREEERTSASRDVHDEIGQHLAVLNLQAYWLANHPEADAELRGTKIDDMQAAIASAMAAVKAVATRLRPMALDTLSLGETVKWYVKDFERKSGIACRCETGAMPSGLDKAVAMAIFRVLQESLSNVARHAAASSVLVRLDCGQGVLSLEVEDDGRGIADVQARADDSFGIIGMHERCAGFGGRLEVSGLPGRGSRVLAVLPLAPAPTEKKEG
jgi:signal transduction histidine kinase/ligand-binding sensor domain-containing protein